MNRRRNEERYYKFTETSVHISSFKINNGCVESSCNHYSNHEYRKNITLNNFNKCFIQLRNIIQNVEKMWKRMIQYLFKIILEYCITGLPKNHFVPLGECTFLKIIN